MFTTYVENIGDMTVIECEGRLVRSEAAFKLRDVLVAHPDTHFVVLDLTAVSAVEGGGLGMLAFLQRWAHDHDIRLKLFNPSSAVRDRLERASFLPSFEIVSLDELLALMSRANGSYGNGSHGSNGSHGDVDHRLAA